MKTVVLATGNQNKVKEMDNLLADAGFEVLPQSQFDFVEAEETGTTFVENAIIKARHAAKHTQLPAIADDSGLEIDALKGAPGVYSSRYSGDNATDQRNYELVLEKLKEVPEQERTARFHCVIVYMKHEFDPTPIVCHGVWEGVILFEPQGENGFGYDPIFWVPELQCSAAELDAKMKKQLSHRGQALQQLFQQMKQEK